MTEIIIANKQDFKKGFLFGALIGGVATTAVALFLGLKSSINVSKHIECTSEGNRNGYDTDNRIGKHVLVKVTNNIRVNVLSRIK